MDLSSGINGRVFKVRRKSEIKVPTVSNLFLKSAVVFLLVGLGIGLKMGISGNHDLIATHTHVNLLGWVSSALFGFYYAINLERARARTAVLHFWSYTSGVASMVLGLLLEEIGVQGVEPLIAAGAFTVYAATLFFAFNLFFIKAKRT